MFKQFLDKIPQRVESIKMDKKRKLTKEEDFRFWFDDFTGEISRHKLSEDQKTIFLRSNFTGAAREVLYGLSEAEKTTLEVAGRFE
jgi:hypothetical protein